MVDELFSSDKLRLGISGDRFTSEWFPIDDDDDDDDADDDDDDR